MMTTWSNSTNSRPISSITFGDVSKPSVTALTIITPIIKFLKKEWSTSWFILYLNGWHSFIFTIVNLLQEDGNQTPISLLRAAQLRLGISKIASIFFASVNIRSVSSPVAYSDLFNIFTISSVGKFPISPIPPGIAIPPPMPQIEPSTDNKKG